MHYRGAIRLSCFAKLSKYNTWSHALKYTITIGTKCLSSTWTQNLFRGSEFVLLFEDEMMRIGLNFWFFDKFASSLSITNCVKNKSQKVTKEMKTPKINNSCPQKNYVTIGLKCLMPSFEENHKNHHKNIWYIFFNSRFIFRTQVMISKHFAKFFLLTFDPVLTKYFKMTFFFLFEICSWLEMFEFWKSSPTEFSNSKSWDESRAWDFNQRDNNHNGW